MINDFFKQMFGDDFFFYSYCKEYGISVDEKVVLSFLEYSYEYWEFQYVKVFFSDVDWEGDSLYDESNSYCFLGVKVEIEYVYVKKDILEDFVSFEDVLCEGFSGFLLDDLLVIGFIFLDVNEKKEDLKFILYDVMVKVKTRVEVVVLFSLLLLVLTKCFFLIVLFLFFGFFLDLYDLCNRMAFRKRMRCWCGGNV